MLQDMIGEYGKNSLRVSYMLCDSWYTNAENIKHVFAVSKHLTGAVKSNLKLALSLANKKAGKFARVESTRTGTSLKQVYIRQLQMPVNLCKDLYLNKDGSKAQQ